MLSLTALLTATALAATPGDDGLQRVLDQHLAKGRVDYAAIASSGGLDDTLAAMATAAEPSAKADKMAFWINAYNALTIDLVADEWPLKSIRDLDDGAVWDKRRFTVAGRSVTLNDIEHTILRPMGDPRIHAAVNCASIGCPPLHPEAFRGDRLDAQLTAASEAWAKGNAARIDPQAGTVALSKIFDWYGQDFVPRADTDIPQLDGKQEAAVDFIADHLGGAPAPWLRAGGYTVTWSAYDWGVNAQ